MTTDKVDTTELIASLNETTEHLIDVIRSFNDEELNEIPFEGSWTAAQVAEHLVKVNGSIAKGMNKPGRAVERAMDKRVAELRGMFLNFDSKRKSPDFVEPTSPTNTKDVLSSDLRASVERIKKSSESVNLSEAIDNPNFGEITKLELISFANYHMQRHIQQIRNIQDKISEKNRAL